DRAVRRLGHLRAPLERSAAPPDREATARRRWQSAARPVVAAGGRGGRRTGPDRGGALAVRVPDHDDRSLQRRPARDAGDDPVRDHSGTDDPAADPGDRLVVRTWPLQSLDEDPLRRNRLAGGADPADHATARDDRPVAAGGVPGAGAAEDGAGGSAILVVSQLVVGRWSLVVGR